MGACLPTLLAEFRVALCRLSPAIQGFLEGARNSDRESLLSVCAPGATVVDEDGGGPVSVAEWYAQAFGGAPVLVRALHAATRSDGAVVGAMVCGQRADAGMDSIDFDWTFTERTGQICCLKITRRQAYLLPPPIAATVQSVNLCDLAGLLRKLSADALVVDQGRCYWGVDAIQAWAQAEVIGERLALLVVGVRQHYGATIVLAYVDGDFDRRGLPDPMIVAFHFRLVDDSIVELIITRNDDI